MSSEKVGKKRYTQKGDLQIRLPQEYIHRLQGVALQLECLWGSEGSPTKLLREIGDRTLIVTRSARRRSQNEVEYINNVILTINAYSSNHQPFTIEYRHDDSSTEQLTVRYVELSVPEELSFEVWVDEPDEGAKVPELANNRLLKFNQVISTSLARGDWHPGLSEVEVGILLLGDFTPSFPIKRVPFNAGFEALNGYNAAFCQITNVNRFVSEVLSYADKCIVFEPEPIENLVCVELENTLEKCQLLRSTREK